MPTPSLRLSVPRDSWESFRSTSTCVSVSQLVSVYCFQLEDPDEIVSSLWRCSLTALLIQRRGKQTEFKIYVYEINILSTILSTIVFGQEIGGAIKPNTIPKQGISKQPAMTHRGDKIDQRKLFVLDECREYFCDSREKFHSSKSSGLSWGPLLFQSSFHSNVGCHSSNDWGWDCK